MIEVVTIVVGSITWVVGMGVYYLKTEYLPERRFRKAELLYEETVKRESKQSILDRVIELEFQKNNPDTDLIMRALDIEVNKNHDGVKPSLTVKPVREVREREPNLFSESIDKARLIKSNEENYVHPKTYIDDVLTFDDSPDDTGKLNEVFNGVSGFTMPTIMKDFSMSELQTKHIQPGKKKPDRFYKLPMSDYDILSDLGETLSLRDTLSPDFMIDSVKINVRGDTVTVKCLEIRGEENLGGAFGQLVSGVNFHGDIVKDFITGRIDYLMGKVSISSTNGLIEEVHFSGGLSTRHKDHGVTYKGKMYPPIPDNVIKNPLEWIKFVDDTDKLFGKVEDITVEEAITLTGGRGNRTLFNANVTRGICVACKGETRWDAATGKHDSFCYNPKCEGDYRIKIKSGFTVALRERPTKTSNVDSFATSGAILVADRFYEGWHHIKNREIWLPDDPSYIEILTVDQQRSSKRPTIVIVEE